MITAFAISAMIIMDPKNITSRKSITPRCIDWKWGRKPKLPTACTISAEAQAEKKSNITGEPASVSTKHVAVVITKAITWFFVHADIIDPIAKYAPAIKALPI